MRRIHWLLTSFIVNMPLKVNPCVCVCVCVCVYTCVRACVSDQIHHFQVKELRNHGDEVAREMMMRVVEAGKEAGSLRRDFEELMRLVHEELG